MEGGVHIIVTMCDVGGGVKSTVTSHTSHLWQGLARECEIIAHGSTWRYSQWSQIFAVDSGQF